MTNAAPKPRRTWHRTKAEWAAARAQECRQAALYSLASSYGRKSRAQALSATRCRHSEEARKYEAMAERFKAEGV